MCFNLGKTGLSKFVNFIFHVNRRNYLEASYEMINSKWYNQVGLRAKKLVELIRK